MSERQNMSDSLDRVFGTDTPKPSHAESIVKKSADSSGVNHGKLGQEVTFVDAAGNEEGGFFKSGQGFKCRKENTLLRLLFLHVIIDIKTDNARELKKIFYQKKYNEYAAGGSYDDIKIIDITFHDVGNMPPIP